MSRKSTCSEQDLSYSRHPTHRELASHSQEINDLTTSLNRNESNDQPYDMSPTTITREAKSSRPHLRIGSAGALPNPLGSHPASPKKPKHITLPNIKLTPPTPVVVKSCKTEIDQYLRDIKVNGYVSAEGSSKGKSESDVAAMNLRMLRPKGEAPKVNYETKPKPVEKDIKPTQTKIEQVQKVKRSVTLPSKREVREKSGYSQEWKRMGSVYRFV